MSSKNKKNPNAMNHHVLLSAAVLFSVLCSAQTNPVIINWLQNTTVTGTYYMSGNSTLLSNGELVNCQQVEYSNDYSYVYASGVPAYPTGPFLDGNPSNTTVQNAQFKFPLIPTPAATPVATTAGNIGVFVNGVALFDFRDGVGWNSTTNALCGGPGNPACPGAPGSLTDWSRDAVPAESGGFDCSKGHPAMGNYHHHQNPSAFKLDLNVVSTVCNLYDADALYAIDAAQHSPLLGFAYDGYPIYGAYGYKNDDGTGGITRMRSGYQLRNISVRTHWADGTDVDDGPAVDATYFLGYFREDYEWVAHPSDPEYLDEHNGRFSITPEYPNGIYCYFATVDANWNSAYPYIVGPTFYGEYSNALVSTINEPTTIYTGTSGLNEEEFAALNINVFPNPASELIAIQVHGLLAENLQISIYDMQGRLIKETAVLAGSTIAYIDTKTMYAGNYMMRISNGEQVDVRQVSIVH